MPKYKNPLLLNLQDFETLKYTDFLSYYHNVKDVEFKNLLLISFLTGPRPAEIHILQKQDIQIKNKYILIKFRTLKGGFKRLIALPRINELESFVEYFNKLVFPKEPVFKSLYMSKNPRDFFIKKCIEYNVGKIINGAFYPFSFYYFRHNILTLLAENGADFFDILYFKGASMKYILKSAGHYIHLSLDRAKKIAKIIKKIML